MADRLAVLPQSAHNARVVALCMHMCAVAFGLIAYLGHHPVYFIINLVFIDQFTYPLQLVVRPFDNVYVPSLPAG